MEDLKNQGREGSYIFWAYTPEGTLQDKRSLRKYGHIAPKQRKLKLNQEAASEPEDVEDPDDEDLFKQMDQKIATTQIAI